MRRTEMSPTLRCRPSRGSRGCQPGGIDLRCYRVGAVTQPTGVPGLHLGAGVLKAGSAPLDFARCAF